MQKMCIRDSHVDALQLPVTLISGGRLLHENLRLAGRTEAWVKEQLSHYHCAVRDVSVSYTHLDVDKRQP